MSNAKNSCWQGTSKELDKETGLYYYGARYLNPKYSMWISCDPALGEYIPQAPINDEAKQHNQNLPGLGGVFNTVNLNLYHYAANNPVRYIDPDGEAIDGFLDAVGIAWDIVDIVANPANPWAWASLAADVGCLFIPGLTGGGRAIKALEGSSAVAKAAKAARVAGKADEVVNAIKNGERIFGSYKDMKKITKGYNHAIEAHHLVPQALADLFTKKTDDYASVVLDKTTHTKYSKEWNKVLNNIRNSSDPKAEILKQAELIYKDAPDLLSVTKEFLKDLQ